MIYVKGCTITVLFSCGIASTIAAIKTLEIYGSGNKILIVNNPVKEEHPDNIRFLKDVEKYIDHKIIIYKNKRFPEASAKEVWQSKKFMSGIYGAPCTTELKKNARYQFEQDNPTDYLVLGFTKDEDKRHENFINSERNDVLPVLIDLGLTKEDCFKEFIKTGIKLPLLYSQGFPNNNCIGCVKASSATYWNLVRFHYPEIFLDRAKQSRELGVKLVYYKGERIYLDQLPKDAKGKKLKSFEHIECGVFCSDQ